MKMMQLSFWRRFLAREWFPMTISLVLAVVLWFFVGGEQRVDKNVMIPVEVINLPRDLVISNQFKKEIEVTVNGPRSIIQEIDEKNITRQIDLSKATPGTTVINNEVDSIPVPRGITVLRVQPATIILSLDKLVQKTFQINPVTAGTPAPGYILKGLRMDPDRITITGPQTVLSRYEVLRTRPININGLRESVQQQVPLDLEPAIVELIGETTITADINIALDTVQRELRVKLQPTLTAGGEIIAQVRVIANIPKLLVENKTAVAPELKAVVERDPDTGLGIVRIEQSDKLELPVEVIQIEPATVALPQLESPPPPAGRGGTEAGPPPQGQPAP